MIFIPLCRITLLAILIVLGDIRVAGGQAILNENLVAEAVASIQSGNPSTAISSLDSLFNAQPGWVSSQFGSLAYWLGHAYLESENTNRAIQTWQTGMLALDEANLFDFRLGLAFLNVVFEERSQKNYRLATTVYLRLLDEATFNQEPTFSDSFAPFLEAASIVLPDNNKHWVAEAPNLSVDAARALGAWWRSQDPAPATRNNEMLEEHLERVAYASKQYRIDGRFDDRGRVYIRLGAPSNTTSVQFDKAGFRTKVLDRSLTINESDFPENEFWFYSHVDDAAQFLFYKPGNAFRLGQTRNLLPASLRSGLGSSDRGKEKAKAMVRALEEIYRQLSLYHHTYATRYQDIVAFASLLDDGEIISQLDAAFAQEEDDIDSEGDNLARDLLANSRTATSGDAGLPGSSFDPNRPDLFVNHVMAAYEIEDEMISLHRADYIPRVRASTFDDVAPLPLHFRSARFLDNDGSTRTEIYWRPPQNAFKMDSKTVQAIELQGMKPDDFMIVTSASQKNAGYRERRVSIDRMALPDIGTGEDAFLPAQTLTVSGDTGLYHVAAQWDLYAATLHNNQLPKVGPHIKSNTFNLDSLRALDSAPGRLTMSDLKPMLLPANLEEMPVSIEEIVDVAFLDPAPVIDNETPLVLYFEIYNLMPGSDNKTKYEVTYEIEAERQRRLLSRKNRNQRTSITSSFDGADTKGKEYLILNLSDERKNIPIIITVRVTDTLSGQTVSRAIGYEVR